MTPADVLDALVEDPSRAGLIMDFDGTLAPIVEDPATSALPEGLLEVLEAVADRLALVAIVSGRPAAFLGDRVQARGVRLFGLYGTQEWRDGAPQVSAQAQQWQPALDQARDRFALALAGHPGVVMEDKGLAVALHWRNADDRAGAGAFVEALVGTVAADTGLHAEPGKFVLELRPPLDRDKGTCVEELVAEESLTTVVFVGDDRGDLPAFAAATAAGGLGLAVDHGPETAAEVLAAADATAEGIEAVGVWLRHLERRLTDDTA